MAHALVRPPAGSFKTVFKGQDVNNGNLVAWNEVNIKAYGQRERKRIMNEVMLLRTLLHPNLISFYGGWVNKEAEKVVFITELMSSGTLKEFCTKYPIPLKQIKRYLKEILECMAYLHNPITDEEPASAGGDDGKSKEEASSGAPANTPTAASRKRAKPVVIHRDLKCDNIFIMNQGKGIKIGDLGLATTDGRSILGTPEFMAPEMYEPGYGTSVDIYAFGLCLLEMITGKTPYCECTGVVQIYKRVLAGMLPENIRVVEAGWPEAYDFIMRCLTPLDTGSGDSSGRKGSESDDEEEESEDEGVDGQEGSRRAGEDTSVPDGGNGTPALRKKASVISTVSADASTSHAASGKPPLPHVHGQSFFSADGTSAAGPTPSVGAPSTPASATSAASQPARTLVQRPTAMQLLQDPFLIITEEDATRTTADVRRAAEAKGWFVVLNAEDAHRRTDIPPPQLHLPDSVSIGTTPSAAPSSAAAAIAPAAAPAPVPPTAPAPVAPAPASAPVLSTPAATSALLLPASQPDTTASEDAKGPAAASLSATSSASPLSEPVRATVSRSSSAAAEVPGLASGEERRAGASSSSSSSGRASEFAAPTSAVAASRPPTGAHPVTLQSLADEVHQLRNWVAHTCSLVEWLVRHTEGGKQFLEDRSSRRHTSRRDGHTGASTGLGSSAGQDAQRQDSTAITDARRKEAAIRTDARLVAASGGVGGAAAEPSRGDEASSAAVTAAANAYTRRAKNKSVSFADMPEPARVTMGPPTTEAEDDRKRRAGEPAASTLLASAAAPASAQQWNLPSIVSAVSSEEGSPSSIVVAAVPSQPAATQQVSNSAPVTTATPATHARHDSSVSAGSAASVTSLSTTVVHPAPAEGSSGRPSSASSVVGSTHSPIDVLITDLENGLLNGLENGQWEPPVEFDDAGMPVQLEIQLAINRVRVDCRREEVKLAKMASKQLSETAEAKRKAEEEHSESREAEQSRHDRECEKFERTRQDILKVLLPLRSRRDRAAASGDGQGAGVSENEEDGREEDDTLSPGGDETQQVRTGPLSVREREQEQVYTRKLELLEERQKDELAQYQEAVKRLEEGHDRVTKRLQAREKEKCTFELL